VKKNEALVSHNEDEVMLLQYGVVKQKVVLKGNKEREVEKCVY